MSHQYLVRKKKFTTKEGELKEEFFATAKSIRVIGVDEMAEKITQNSSFTSADVVGTINALSRMIKENLASGYKVKLDGIGVLGVSLTSKGVETEKELDPKKVRFSRVTFKADNKLVRELKEIKFTRERPLPKGIVIKSKGLK
ncbi:MAG: HU family DNA-binding protein [Bacteroidales bacterium]|jgi:predicted histone-like DNA-binding protein|nr:HU family DNA-binding protein [Bacteroidales bacterium]MDD4002354.1 HU family DNA-binding protein [Bacteroidales bacterium]MDD4529101.1 HU family DNA-binding protein [Bacteroidales bacterium]MDD4828927.1 HU family DNA-binding protein [Bacteroidales bacterium]